jgi:uncharacterized protein YdaU (DUF1376 family)
MKSYYLNIVDYTSATAHLEPLEDLAHRRLLDLYYSTEKPIVNDFEKVARLIRMQMHCDLIKIVLEEFFTLENDEWHCDRADWEIFKHKENEEDD